MTENDTTAAMRAIVTAAEAYADSAAATIDTPQEDALLDAVADYRAALAASRPPQEETSAEVFALREAAAQARWNVNHREGGTDNLDAYERHWRGTAVWLEKRAAAIEHGEQPDRGYRPVPAALTDEEA